MKKHLPSHLRRSGGFPPTPRRTGRTVRPESLAAPQTAAPHEAPPAKTD
ncbi:hypothetical protein [Streptomyces sp. PsTaAH-124]|nr:hypothetical protein [Streptomyces sp. PsTaAH-124]